MDYVRECLDLLGAENLRYEKLEASEDEIHYRFHFDSLGRES
ncbi:MAG: hypothetical protein R6V85_00460 [Polyangia bacterium]